MATDGKKTCRIYCLKAPEFSLAIRDGMVALKPANANDQYQHWFKDERYSTRVKDDDGWPSFSLVNKAIGLGIKHATAAKRLVQLESFPREGFDETVLWSRPGRDDEYHAIRPVNNVLLNLDAFGGDAPVDDQTQVGLWKWTEGKNQLWKISYY